MLIMPAYRIHRLKQMQRQQFRWAPHAPGVSIVKLKDYEPGPVVDAPTPYALWLRLRETEDAMAVGDLIEQMVEDVSGQPSPGDLRILKYIGFEEARWYVPEPVPNTNGEPVAVV